VLSRHRGTTKRRRVADRRCCRDETVALTPLGSSRHRHVSARHVRHDECVALVVRVEPCLFQHDGRRRSSSARVYKFSLLCSGFASISGITSGKSEVDMSTTVHAVAAPLCRASRACRDERVAPCCPTSATRLDTTCRVSSRLFSMPKCIS